jgi:hypothetical protein
MPLLRLLTLALGIALATASQACNDLPRHTTLRTRVGVIKVWAGLTGFSKLTVNDRKIPINVDGDPDLTLHAAFDRGRDIAVLLSSNPGGFNWSDHLYFMILGDGTKPVTISDEAFLSETCKTTIAYDKATHSISVDLGFDDGRRKTATLVDDKLSISMSAPQSGPLDRGECKSLYEVTTDDCLEVESEYHFGCSNTYPGLSNATMSVVTIAANYPGFDNAKLLAACKAQCEAKAAMSYSDFSRAVCGF